MTEPFRVVVDWAGSAVEKVDAERSFERGLVRRILTKQFSSEAEQISRVTIELSRETAYRVEAVGTKVRVHFVPVPDPIPEPQPVAAPAPKVEEKVVAQIPEGPLTEPDLPVPTDLPPMPKPKVIAKAPEPAPAPVVVAKVEPKPVPATPAPAPAPLPAKKEVAPEPIAIPTTLASNRVETPKAPEKPVEAPAPAPAPAPVVVAKLEPKAAPVVSPPKPAAAPEPVKLATLAPVAVTQTKPPVAQPVPDPVAKVEAPAPAPTQVSLASTQRLASAAPRPAQVEATKSSSGWSPPGVVPSVRERSMKQELPVVKIAQEAIQPSGSTPADADVDDPASGPQSADANDFDPGPRVMKYVGFQQMADVSRVFVRVDGKAKYKQSKDGGSKVVIELMNTSINVKNNERPLDTTYFNSPVSKVQAVRSGDNTRIEISLREGSPFTVKRIGTTIAVDFKRGG